jgi:hypothetical protein
LYPLPVIIADVIVFILALIAVFISVAKTNLVTKSLNVVHWWWLLPLILLWTAFVRFLYVLTAIGELSPAYTPWITASQIVFYVGLVIFLWDFYTATRDLIH